MLVVFCPSYLFGIFCFTIFFKPNVALKDMFEAFIPFAEQQSNEWKRLRFGFPKGFTEGSLSIRHLKFNGQHLDDLFRGMVTECFRSITRTHMADDCWHKLAEFQTVHNSKNQYASITWGSLSVIYSYYTCMLMKGQFFFCPDPCLKNPCQITGGVKCKRTGTGLFVHNFICECAKFFEWDQDRLTCARLDACKSRLLNPCVLKNTAQCEVESTKVRCKCKDGYMGATCEKPRDACIRSFDPGLPRGHDACAPNGKCEAVLGTSVYNCKCNPGYTDDPHNKYRDCMKRENKCEALICVHGFCHTLEGGAKCACDEGYGGLDCSYELPHWGPWQPWSECESCGNPRHRKRIRKCSVESTECVGNPEDLQTCSPKPCLVDGEWFDWGSWTVCSVNCGGGQRVRTRQCFYDTPVRDILQWLW